MVRYDSKSCVSHCYIPFSCYSRSKCLLFTFVCSSMTNPLSQACSYWEIISNEVMPKHSIYKEVPIVQAETLKKVFPFQNSQILLRTLTKKTQTIFHSQIFSSSLTQHTRASVCDFLLVFLEPLTHIFKGIPSETSLPKTFHFKLTLAFVCEQNQIT